MARDKVDALFDDLYEDGWVENDREKFRSFFLAPGQQGYENRKRLYEEMKAEDYVESPTYEEFARRMGLHAVGEKPEGNKANKPVGGGVVAGVPQGATSMQGLDYFRLRRGGSDFVVPVKDVDAAGGLVAWEKKNPGAPVRVYMSGVDKAGNPFSSHVPVSEAHKRVKDYGYKYNLTNDTTYPEQVAEYEQRTVVERLEKEQDDLMKKAEERRRSIEKGQSKSWMSMMVDGLMASESGQLSASEQKVAYDPEYRQLIAAAREKGKEIAQRKRLRDKAKGEDIGFWRGFGDTVKEPDLWLGGIPEAYDALGSVSALENPNTESAQALLEAKMDRDAADREGDFGLWYGGGLVAANMLPFMVDMGVSGAITGSEKFVGKGVGKALSTVAGKRASALAQKASAKAMAWASETPVGRLLAKGAETKVGQVVTKAIGAAPDDLIRAAFTTNVIQQGKTFADIVDRKTGQVVDAGDSLRFQDAMDWGRAIAQGEMNGIIENYSESFGNVLDEPLSAASKHVSKKLASVFGMKAVSRGLCNMVPKGMRTTAAALKAQLQEHFKLSGFVGELSEEYWGQLLRTVCGSDDAYDEQGRNNFLKWEFHRDLWSGMALSMGFMNGVTYGASAAHYGAMKVQLEGASRNASKVMGKDEWDEIRAQIDACDNDNVMEVVAGIADESGSREAAGAVFEYGLKLAAYRGYNIGVIASEDGGELRSGTDQNGVDAEVEAARADFEAAFGIDADYWMERVEADVMDVLSEPTLNEDRRMAVLRYVGARRRAAARVSAAEAVRAKVHPNKKTIVPAVLKLGDQQVFIVGGDVVMSADGKVVDLQRSSRSVLVYNAETGETKFVEPSAILRVEAEVEVPPQSPTPALPAREGVMESPTPALPAREGAVPAESVPDSAVSTTENGENSAVAEAPVAETALSRVPVDEKGKAQFDKVEPGLAWDAVMEKTGGNAEMAKEYVDNMVTESEKALAKLERGKPKSSTDIDEFIANKQAHQDAIAEAKRVLEHWKAVAEEDGARQAKMKAEAEIAAEERERREARDAERQANREANAKRLSQYREAIKGMGDVNSLREYIIRLLLSGKVKLRWDKTPSGSRGVNSYVFGFRGNVSRVGGEYGARRWMLDDNGISVDTFIEDICQQYFSDYERDTDHTHEVGAELTDILLMGSPDALWNALMDERAAYEEAYMDGGYYPESTPEEIEREQAFLRRYGMIEEDWLEFESAHGEEIDMSDEEYAELMDELSGERADDDAVRARDEELLNELLEENARQNYEAAAGGDGFELAVEESGQTEGTVEDGSTVGDARRADVDTDLQGSRPSSTADVRGSAGSGVESRSEVEEGSEVDSELAERQLRIENGELLPESMDEIPQEWRDSRIQSEQAVEVESPLEIPDDVFRNYSQSYLLPKLPENLARILNAIGRKVLLKRGVFAKNNITHGERSNGNMTAQESKELLNRALYSASLAIKNQPETRPYNWVVVRLANKNDAVVLEVNNTKEYLEIVGWEYRSDKKLRNLYNQANRNGGLIIEVEESQREDDPSLIQDSEEPSAAGLSALPRDSEGKDSALSADMQASKEEISEGGELRSGTEQNGEARLERLAELDARVSEVNDLKDEDVVLPEGVEDSPSARREHKMKMLREAVDELAAAAEGLSDQEVKDLSKEFENLSRVTALRRERQRQEQERQRERDKLQTTYDNAEALPVSGKKPKKFSMHEVAHTDNVNQAMIAGVHHSPTGEAVATDTHVIVVSKKDFKPEHEGKVVDKNGAPVRQKVVDGKKATMEEAKGQFPAYERLLPKDKPVATAPLSDEAVQAACGVSVRGEEKAYIAVDFGDGNIMTLDLYCWNRFLRGAKHIGATELEFRGAHKPVVARTEDGWAMCMPVFYVSEVDKMYRQALNSEHQSGAQFSIGESRERGEHTELAHKAVIECLRRGGIEVEVVTREQAMAKAEQEGVDMLETANGTVYGWTEGGRIFLTEDGLDAETPVHEYTHLWVAAMQKNSPKTWRNIVALLKGTEMWDEVARDPMYANIRGDENAIASEVLSRIGGAEGRRRFEEEAKKVLENANTTIERARITAMIDRIRRAARSFWAWVGQNLFGIKKFKSIDEVTDRVLYDLTRGTKLDKGDKEKSLAGVHNISVDKIRKAMKMGGLANPSLAVIDVDRQLHDGYGAISLIMPSEKINKGKHGSGGTFTGDAWTPMYPAVERSFTGKGSRLAYEDIEKLPMEMRSAARAGLNRWMDGKSAVDMSYWFLHEKGMAPELEFMHSTMPRELTDRVYELMQKNETGYHDGVYIEDAMPQEDYAELEQLYIDNNVKGDRDAYNYLMDEFRKTIEKNASRAGIFGKNAKLELEALDKGRNPLIEGWVNTVMSDRQREGRFDLPATEKAAQAVVDDSPELLKEFEEWLESLMERYGIKEELFNGFTPSGNRRYLPHTLENVSKLMRQQGKNGSEAWANKTSHVMAPLSTTEEVSVEQDRLVSDRGELRAFDEAWMEDYQTIREVCGDGDWFIGEARLDEALGKANPALWLRREYGVELTSEQAKVLGEMQRKVRKERPAMYFETKFERPVKFNEFAAAVVPEGTPADVVDFLRSQGLQVETYESDNESSRQEAMQRATQGEGVRFRLGDEESFEERQRRAVANKGTVTPGLKDMEFTVVDVPRHDFTGTGKQAIDKAFQWALNNLVGEHTAHKDEPNEFKYLIDDDVIGKYLSESSTKSSDNLGIHLAVLKELKAIINASIEVEEHADYRKINGARSIANGLQSEDVLMHRFYGAVTIDGVLYRVKTSFKEMLDVSKTHPYNYQVTELELLISGSKASDALSNPSSITGAKLLNGVEKSYDAGKKILDENPKSEGGVRFKKRTSPLGSRKHVNNLIDTTLSMLRGRPVSVFAAERRAKEQERRERTKELYDSILNLQFDDVTLQKIYNYVEEATPKNPHGRRISQRLPQRVEHGLHARQRKDGIDALFSRAAEGAVSPSDRKSSEGARRIEAKKKEIVRAYAQAVGQWFERIEEIPGIGNTELIDEGKDAKVYSSADGQRVIKVKRGKPWDKRFHTDLDDISLFNTVFRYSQYDIIGYGDFGDGVATVVSQPFVQMSDESVSVAERVEYMRKLGFEPINKENTAFSDGEIIAADIQGKNIVKDVDGNIRVIDADMKLHTKADGGLHSYPDVEKDWDGVRFRVGDLEQEGNPESLQRKVDGLAERLGVKVRVVKDLSELGNVSARQRKAKGWFDIRTGEVVIVVPNHMNVSDIENTVLHEIVGHKGLRKLVGEEKFGEFLDNVYAHASKSVKPLIDERIPEGSRDSVEARRLATEEYLADLAGRIGERGFEKMDAQEKTLWGKVCEMIQKLIDATLKGLGIPKSVQLSERQMSYIVYKSWKNLREEGGGGPRAFAYAEDVAMRERSGFNLRAEGGELRSSTEQNGSNEGRFRIGDEVDGGRLTEEQKERQAKTKEVRDRLSWSEEKALNGEPFLVDVFGNIDLIDIPQSVFDVIGIEKIPFRLTPSMIAHFYWRHHKELRLNSPQDAVYTILDVMSNFDHVRKGDNNTYIFSVEETHNKSARRAVTLVLEYDNGKWLGVKTFGLDGIDKLKKLPILWEKGEVPSSAAGVATANVNSAKSSLSDQTSGIASNQSMGVSERKDNGDFENMQDIEDKSSFGEVRSGTEQNDADGLRFRLGDDVLGVGSVAAREIYEQRVRTSGYQVREAMLDSMLGLREAYDAIEKASGRRRGIEDIPTAENAYTGENRLSSRTREEQKAYEELCVKPLLDEVAKLAPDKESRAELTEYMMAKHGLERNAKMRARAVADGMDAAEAGATDFAGLTGLAEAAGEVLTGNRVAMAEAWAAKRVADYESGNATDALWAAVNAATKATLSKLYEGGLLSKAAHDDIAKMYDFYIPLRGWAETTTDEVYGYLTRTDAGVRKSVLKEAEGRSSVADDPIATIAMMGEHGIAEANRNMMKQSFLNYVRRNPSDLVSVNRLWLKKNDVSGEWEAAFPDNIYESDDAATVAQKWEAFEAQMEALAQAEPDRFKRGRQAQGIPYKIGEGVMNEHAVMVKCGDDVYVLTINGNPRAAQALNGLTNPDNGTGYASKLIKYGDWVNHWIAPAYTTRNPDFMLSNFLRDAFYTNTMTWVKESPGYAARFNMNFLRVNPIHMIKLISLYEKGELDMSNPLHRHYRDFMQNGGETGYTSQRDLEKHKKDIERMLKQANGRVNVRKIFQYMGAKWDVLNNAAENCARFAAYLTSREEGRDVGRSIWDAKEISVNFNKKGAGAKFLDATGQTAAGNAAALVSGTGRGLFVFWNAVVQASTNYMRNAKRHPVKFTAGMTAMFGLGLLQAIFGAWDDDDDDDKKDDRNDYYNQPDYVRRSHLLLGLGDKFLAHPLPHEYLPAFGMGELAGSLMTGKQEMDGGEIALEMAGLLSEFSPIKLSGASTKHSFIPSNVKPIVEAAMNESWTGLPIYKETPYNEKMPEWTKAYPSANHQLVNLCEAVSRATGGNDYRRGSVEINPAAIEYVLNGYLGGYFKMLDRTVKVGETVAGTREFEWRNMPFASRVIKQGDERTAGRRVSEDYWKLKQDYEETDRLIRSYKNDPDRARYTAALAELSQTPEFRNYWVFEGYKKSLDGLDDLMKGATGAELKALEGEQMDLRRELVGKIRGKVALEPGDMLGFEDAQAALVPDEGVKKASDVKRGLLGADGRKRLREYERVKTAIDGIKDRYAGDSIGMAGAVADLWRTADQKAYDRGAAYEKEMRKLTKAYNAAGSDAEREKVVREMEKVTKRL